MVDVVAQKTQDLTQEGEIKKLELSFTLTQGDLEQQQLVESWLTFFEDALIGGEGADANGKIGILPNLPINSIPFNSYKLGKRVVTENKERFNSPYSSSDALFPTDIFSILSGIAALLVAKNYGIRELAGYKREPKDSVWLLKWATRDGKISETYLLQHSHQILRFISELRSILGEFYSNGARPPLGYIAPGTLAVRVATDISPSIFEYLKPNTDHSELAIERILLFLTKDPEGNQYLLRFFIDPPIIEELLRTPGRFTPMLAVQTRDGDIFFLETFVEESWYKNKRSFFIETLARRFQSTFSQYFDAPKQSSKERAQPAKSSDSSDETETGGETQTDIPPIINPPESKERPYSPPSAFEIRSLDPTTLSKEAAVVTTFFLYQQFASQGIPFDEAERLLGQDIRQELLSILATYPDSQIAQLFLSRSTGNSAGSLLGRKRLFEDLLKRLSSRPDIMQRAGQLYGQYGLNIETTGFTFSGDVSSEGIFKQQLDSFFNLSDPTSTLSITLPTNAINRLDTIILSYGLNDFLTPQEREGHQDAVWFIENLDANKLALIFFPQLPPEQARQLIHGKEKQLISILVGYVKTRGAELILHTYTNETALGFFNGVSKEDQQAVAGSTAEFHRHFNFSSHPMGDIADQVSQGGGEKAAGVFVASAKSKQQQKLEELYKIFIPDWLALGSDGQRRAYELFNLAPMSAGPDSDQYLFLYEFISLTREQVRQLREPLADMPEYVSTGRQVIFITEEQLVFSRDISILLRQQHSELLLGQQLTQQYMVGLSSDVISDALAYSGPGATYDDLSLQRLYQAEAGALSRTNDEAQISEAVEGDRRPGSRNKGGFLGGQIKQRARKTAQQHLGKILGQKGLEQLTGMATSPWLTAAKWLMDQENRPIIGGALLGLGSAIYNMFTNSAALGGGIGGGLAGAGVGFWLGGPVGALIGGIAGMTLGAGGMAALFPKFGAATATTGAAAPSVLPYSVQTGLGAGATPWTAPPTNTATQGAGSSAAQQAAAQQAAAQQAAQQAAAQQAAATTAATAPAAATTATAQVALAKLLSGVGTATLAPIVFLFITIGASMYTLTLIQSAFLVSAPFDSRFTAPAQAQFFKCTSASIPKPTSANVIRSTDGKYAFPLDGSFAGGMSCPHWDKTWVTDIFTLPGEAPVDQEAHLPILAYTDATVYMVVTNDSLGGLYVILKGDDGRWYYYAHNCAIYVTPGQRVVAGEIISISDRTGINAAVTPEHLHFGIQDGGSEPTFYHGGNVCPAIEFNEKFTDPQLTVCKLAPDCVTRLDPPLEK